MPDEEKKKEERDEGALKRLKDVLIEKFSTVVIENISDRIHELAKKLQDALYLTQKKMIEQFYVSASFFAGCLFIILAVFFYLTDALQWPRAQASAVVGICIMALSFMLKQYVLKTRSI